MATGINASAILLPYVIVPVLSRINTFTSPHDSTERPLLAKILNCVTRSIPAIPIADNSPPIVVGIKHTVKAINITIDKLKCRNCAKGYIAIITTKKIMVNVMSNVNSAISFGVFFLVAPSTK